MKSLLLYFDGVALSLPSNLLDQVLTSDPVLAQPLWNQGLLINLEPETYLDGATRSRLAQQLATHLESGDFSPIGRAMQATRADPHWGGDHGRAVEKILEERNLGKRIPGSHDLWHLNPDVNECVAYYYANILSRSLHGTGAIELHPIAFDVIGTAAHLDVLYPPAASHRLSQALLSDVGAVGIDLTDAPLDEVLDYRRGEGALYRVYARQLLQFLLLSKRLDHEEFEEALALRREEILDTASTLREANRQFSDKKSAVVMALGIASAGWTLASDEAIIAAVLAGAAAAAELLGRHQSELSSYSYWFHWDRTH